ncbi:Ion transport protein-domain-containing protein [Entophlyctis helioformis]|nr:Ion transport protein-domain-containing protein [Entophlyctis helioformis]
MAREKALHTQPHHPLTFSSYLRTLLKSSKYELAMFCIVCVDVARIAFEADLLAASESNASTSQFQVMSVLSIVFMSIYVVDIVARIYCDRYRFWRNVYNMVDLTCVIIYLVHWVVTLTLPTYVNDTALRLLRALRIIRIFRIIPFIRGLQVVVDALLGTLRTNVVDIMILLSLFIFVAGIIGHFLFGTSSYEGYSKHNWELPEAFLTLWIYVCADGWTTYQDNLVRDGYVASELVTIAYIFVGNFIIANLFIGVICQNVDEAARAERQRQAQQRREAKIAKRELFLRKQRRDMFQLVAQKTKRDSDFQDIVKDMVGALRHDEIIPTRHLSLNLTWLETFVVTLHYHENTMFRCQQSHFAMAHALAEYVDKRLLSKQEL